MSDFEIKRITTENSDDTSLDGILVETVDINETDVRKRIKFSNYTQLNTFIGLVTPATGITLTEHFIENLQLNNDGTLNRSFAYFDMDDGLDYTRISDGGWINDMSSSLSSWLLIEYNNWIKLNSVESDGSLPDRTSNNMGAADTIIAGSVVEVGGELWIDGYANEGINSYSPNNTTILVELIPTDKDLIDGDYHYAYRIYENGGADRIECYFVNTGNNFRILYRGDNVTESVSATSVIANKKLLAVVTIESSGGNLAFHLNGLLCGIDVIANNFAGSAIIDASSTIGASTDSGTFPLDGYIKPYQIANEVMSYYDIRKTSLKSMGYGNPLAHHNAYMISGNNSSSARLVVSANTNINNVFVNAGTIYFEAITRSRVGVDRLFAKANYRFVVRSDDGFGARLSLYHKYDAGVVEAEWRFTDPIVVFNEPYSVKINFDATTTPKQPIIIFEQNNIKTTLTVGDGLTEVTPAGTAPDSDSSSNLGILDDPAGGTGTNSDLLQFALFQNVINSNIEFGQNLSSLSSSLYLMMGDYLDSSVYDYIDTNGNGIIYDATQETQLGADLVDVGAGTFDSGTYSWTAQGTNIIANVDSALQITYVNDSTGALQILNATSGDLSQSMTNGRVYILQFDAVINTGACNIQLNFSTFNVFQAITTINRTYSLIFRHDGTAVPLFRAQNMSAGEILTIDNWSLTPVQGNPALPVSMTHANLIETRSTDYLTYTESFNVLLSPTVYLIGYGTQFINKTDSNASISSTNTTRNGEDWMGLAKIAYNGTTSYTNLSSLISGSFPTHFTLYFAMQFDDWNEARNQDLFYLAGAIDSLRVYKTSGGLLGVEHSRLSTNINVTVDCSTYVGIKHIFVIVTSNYVYLYVDGELADSAEVDGVFNDTISSCVLGATNTTPNNVIDGDILEFLYIEDNALSATEVSNAHGA